MKIDHVIFSTSETFALHWNLISRVYKTAMNIEPVCIFFGDRSKVDLSEEFGHVVQVPMVEGLPLLIHITWSKFFFPTVWGPDKTWLIGDIDLYPLQRHWFTGKISDIPDDCYVHLDCNGITQLSRCPSWEGPIEAGSPRLSILVDKGCPTNVPGHYHVAKGSILKTALQQSSSWDADLRHIVESKRYNNTRAFREEDPIEQHNLWCAEELRSTKALRDSLNRGLVKFQGLVIKNGGGGPDGDRIEGTLSTCESDYVYHPDRLRSGGYVDLHSARPFHTWMAQTEAAIRTAGML